MVTTLFLIRHGETEGADTKCYKGTIDVRLAEKGIRQMKETSVFLKNYLSNSMSSRYSGYLRDIHGSINENMKLKMQAPKIRAVYCSNLSRAVKSAEIISDPYSIKPIEVPDFKERNFGKWEGMSFNEIKEKYPGEFEAWAVNPLKFSPMGGESSLEVKERVLPALEGIIKNHEDEQIAVVAHGGVNRIILCYFLGIPLENIFRIEQDYAAVNIIEFWDAFPVVKLINGKTSSNPDSKDMNI
jgi:broad specificity phosphatase PhoE